MNDVLDRLVTSYRATNRPNEPSGIEYLIVIYQACDFLDIDARTLAAFMFTETERKAAFEQRYSWL